MTLAPDLVEWIEQRAGGRVAHVDQQVRWRAHYFVTVERPEGRIELLVRFARQMDPGGSLFIDHFSIEREARVIEALQGHDLAIPEYFGFNAEHQCILMSKAAGTNELREAPDDDTRLSVMLQYIEQLAHLHSLDVNTMVLEGIDVPRTPEEIAFAGKFAYMEADYARWRPVLRPEPLLEFGIRWLHANVPTGDRRVAFVQGDTGPGQFMFHEGKVTALIDWELAHIGDPMLDLGVARMRNMLYPTGPMAAPLAHYEAVTGKELDREALGFYTVLAMLLSPMGMVAAMQAPLAKGEGMVARFGWDATLRRGFSDALAEVLGFEIEPPELPEPPTDAPPGLADYLVDHLEAWCVPLATDAAGAFQMETAMAIARTVKLEARVGAELLAADLDDMSRVLGQRPPDRDAARDMLQEAIDEDWRGRTEELVWLFARTERRREYLLRPMMIAQESGAFERLAPGHQPRGTSP
jgi:aminoglycoside phosphotransferase (APT) family kinase protein